MRSTCCFESRSARGANTISRLPIFSALPLPESESIDSCASPTDVNILVTSGNAKMRALANAATRSVSASATSGVSSIATRVWSMSLSGIKAVGNNLTNPNEATNSISVTPIVIQR